MTRKSARARARDIELRALQQESYDRYISGQTFKEIGKAMGCDQHTASLRARDATERLAAEIKDRPQLVFERNFANLQKIQQVSLDMVLAGNDPHGIHAKNLVLSTREINKMFTFTFGRLAVTIEEQPPPLGAVNSANVTQLLRMAIAAKSPEPPRNEDE